MTPLPTKASVEFTILMPLAPFSTLPEILTAPVLVSVTVELFAARAELSSPAAVTRSIWLSTRAFLLCFLPVDVFDLL